MALILDPDTGPFLRNGREASMSSGGRIFYFVEPLH